MRARYILKQAQVTPRTMRPASSSRSSANRPSAQCKLRRRVRPRRLWPSTRPGVEGGIGGHVMPRYFFNISDDDYSVLDRERMELPNQKAAESQAIALAQTFASRDPTPLDVVVTDSEGTALYRTQIVGTLSLNS